VRIAVVYPSLLGTYGDRGNAVVLRERCRRRGIQAEVMVVDPGQAVPALADVYLLGGAEDAMQEAAARLLANQTALPSAAERGAPVLAVCAGYQLLGQAFPGSDGTPVPGLGLLDVTSVRGENRAVGHLATNGSRLPHVPSVLGFENHRGRTVLGPEAEPLAHVSTGIGNGDGTEGAIQGHVVGTYAHGPVLALNPSLADLILSWVLGPLAPLDDTNAERAREARTRRIIPRRALLRR
jgi:CobQ-like glutamine amidotransferase family enzyme